MSNTNTTPTAKNPTYISVTFGKHVEDMTLADVESAIEDMEQSFAWAREAGDGISTKETVSHRALLKRRAELKLGRTFDDETFAALTRMFARA